MSSSALYHPASPLVRFRDVLYFSVLLRVGLILYSEWHDKHSIVKYTDVDYRVFSDAARFLLFPNDTNNAQGPLNLIITKLGLRYRFKVGDPYTRETYRYTPLLALLLTPNSWLHPSFGKYLFAACDILNGILIYKLLIDEILPGVSSPESPNHDPLAKPNPRPIQNTAQRPRPILTRPTLFASIHLLNPLVFTISTRGSSESLLATFVLFTLYAALKGRWAWAGVMLGLATHWKVYPVIYGVGCLSIIGAGYEHGDGEKEGNKSRKRMGNVWGWVRTIVNWRTIRFGMISAGTFGALGGVCYLVWGYPFIYESYLYHLHRLDHRHNFSPYFYLTYLTYPSPNDTSPHHPLSTWTILARSPLISFVPQMTLALGTGLLLGRRRQDLVFTWFVQTAVFVLFNKVCTSQYFLWYLLLLPLLLPRIRTTRLRGFAYVGVWAGVQALWLGEAYKLEFLGKNVFLGVWLRGCVYVIGNVWVLGGIMQDYIV